MRKLSRPTHFAQTLPKPLGNFTQSCGQLCPQGWAIVPNAMGNFVHRYGQNTLRYGQISSKRSKIRIATVAFAR